MSSPKGIDDVIDLVVKTFQVPRTPTMVQAWKRIDVPEDEVWDTFYNCFSKRGDKNKAIMEPSEVSSFYYSQKEIKAHRNAEFTEKSSEKFFAKLDYESNIQKDLKVRLLIRDNSNVIDRDPANHFKGLDPIGGKYSKIKAKADDYIFNSVPDSCDCSMGFKYYYFKEEKISLCVSCTLERLKVDGDAVTV